MIATMVITVIASVEMPPIMTPISTGEIDAGSSLSLASIIMTSANVTAAIVKVMVNRMSTADRAVVSPPIATMKAMTMAITAIA